MRGPIPLPDAEVVERCAIVRAMLAVEQIADCPDFLRSRVLRWAGEADAAGFDLLALGWPDDKHCFAIAPRTATGAPVLLAPPAILAAYRHALKDPHACKVFYPLAEHCQGGAQ
jgi:hypothetical protein